MAAATTKKVDERSLELSWLTFAKAFWNERFLAAGIALAVSVAGIFVVRRLPVFYKAEALVLVDSQKVPERFVSSTVTADVQDRLTTISQEILSATRLNRIIEDLSLYKKERETHVREEVIEMMRKDLEVKVERAGGGGRPGAFRISYMGRDAATVAAVTNRIANLYIEENLRTREVLSEGTSEFIEHQLQEAKAQLDGLEARLSQYKLRHNGELPQQEVALSSTLNRLQSELNGVQDALSRAEQSKTLLQNSLAIAENSEAMLRRAAQPKAVAATGGTVPSSTVAALRRSSPRVEQLTAQLQTLRDKYSEQHPDVQSALYALQRAQAADREAMAREAAAATEVSPNKEPTMPSVDASPDPVLAAQLVQVRERTQTIRTQMKSLDREIESRQVDSQRILKEIASYQARVESMPIREQEMSALMRDYDISQANYRSLLEKKQAAEMSNDLERRQKAERFTILDPARVPERPAKPNRRLLYALCSLGGLGLGVAVAIGKGLRKNTLLGEWELPKGVPILGRVPRIDASATRRGESAQGALLSEG